MDDLDRGDLLEVREVRPLVGGDLSSLLLGLPVPDFIDRTLVFALGDLDLDFADPDRLPSSSLLLLELLGLLPLDEL